jgi:hypothetical protein
MFSARRNSAAIHVKRTRIEAKSGFPRENQRLIVSPELP